MWILYWLHCIWNSYLKPWHILYCSFYKPFGRQPKQMAQLELLIVAPRSHICWDAAPAACLALLSWSSASPTLLLAKPFPTSQQAPPAALPGAGIPGTLTLSLHRRRPQSEVCDGILCDTAEGDSLWHLEEWSSFDTVQQGTLLQRLQGRWISSRVRRMLHGLLRLRSLGLLEYTEVCARILCARPIWLTSSPLTTHPQHPNYCNFSFAWGAHVHALFSSELFPYPEPKADLCSG